MRRCSPDELIRLGGRLWAYVVKSASCWEWTGAVTTAGYGQLRIGHRGPAIGVHRLAYLLTVGPIADGLYVCHSCDNRRCVRPDHLWLGTNRDNQLDARSKGRSAVGEANGQSILTAFAVREIRRRAAAGETHESIARSYGVTRPAIGHVVRGRNWSAVV